MSPKSLMIVLIEELYRIGSPFTKSCAVLLKAMARRQWGKWRDPHAFNMMVATVISLDRIPQ